MEMKEGLEQLFGGGTVEIGASTVDVTWPGGHFSFAPLGDTAYFRELNSNQPGGLTEIVVKLLPLLREQGFRYATALNESPDAAAWLTSIGFEPDGSRPGLWRSNLAVGGRGEQWAAWKRGDGPEPAWHRS